MKTADKHDSCLSLRAPGSRSRLCSCLCIFLSSLALTLVCNCPCLSQTELGSEDDLTVRGTDGTAADPDAEIKGFTVFGSTQAAYTGAAAGPGNVIVNGVLAVSSGAYFVGNSTFTGAGKIFINDGTAGQLLRRNTAGYLEWVNSSSLGDNLGSHIATTTLNMAGNSVLNVDSMSIVGLAGTGGAVLTISTGTSTMMQFKGNGEIIAKKITVGEGDTSLISTASSDINLAPGGDNVNVTKNLNVASGYSVGFEGSAGDSYMLFNSGYVSVYVNGAEIARFKP